MDHEINYQPTQTPGAVTEGGRRPTGVTAPGGPPFHPPHDPLTRPECPSPSSRPNPEVSPKAERRRFTKDYKLDILKQADTCSEPGQIGALLRREGLFSSCITKWRRQRKQGRLGNPNRKKRGPMSITDKSTVRLTDGQRIHQLEQENERLNVRLQQAELILEIQKKVSAMLGIPLKHSSNEGSDS